MILGPAEQLVQAELKDALQEGEPRKFENLVAALVGDLLGVTVSVAKTGFQHGGDAGSAGRQGRRFRIECKRYSDTTDLSARELLGEVDHALMRDPALEAWVLAATREVPEQLEQDLNRKGEAVGVPILVLDFKASTASSLAALCSHAPEIVEQLHSTRASDLARKLTASLSGAVEELNRDLAAWKLGYNLLCSRSHMALEEVWNAPRASQAALGQNAAGGASVRKIRRRHVHQSLDEWWSGPSTNDAPAALVGRDGVGKTWAAIDWLVDRQNGLPITFVIPSSAVAGLSISETGLKSFIADRLHELAGVRDREHWLRRLGGLLQRPDAEGPVFALLFDGLNQEPQVNWLALLKLLQTKTFAGRVRVLVSTRRFYHQTKLADFRGLVVPAALIAVEGYDATPGGELDQLLELNDLDRSELSSDLLELARTPRLFRLIVKLHGRLAGSSGVTVHRLLWEYGRDTVGERAARSFSEYEWRDWLREVAAQYQQLIAGVSLGTLSQTAARPDLNALEVSARLSDIVDGELAVASESGVYHLRPEIVAHALGLALLSALEAAAPAGFDQYNAHLNEWLDPIADFDQRAEILRAAVSIWLERGGTRTVAGVLVAAWLQTQNVAETHRKELSSLAPLLVDALLDTVEHSERRTHASARWWALQALHSLDRTKGGTLDSIAARLAEWCSVVSREFWLRRASPDSATSLAERFRTRVGIDESRPIDVFGVRLKLVDDDDEMLGSTGLTLLEGVPLANAKRLFEIAAISHAVGRADHTWRTLKWLVLLNEADPIATRSMLRELSAEVRQRSPEPGVNADLSKRAGALLLWLTGSEQDSIEASECDPGLDRVVDYQRDYLANPSSSFFALERRHAADALADDSLQLIYRIKRTSELWFDPTFEAPTHFVDQFRSSADTIDVLKLGGHSGTTVEDHVFETIEPVLARLAPDLLFSLALKRVRQYPDRKAEERNWLAFQATALYLVAGVEESQAARQLRLAYPQGADASADYAASQLLMLELRNQDALEQAISIVDANVTEFTSDFAEILQELSGAQADVLIDRFAGGDPLQRKNLLFVLSINRVDFTARAWSWLSEVAFADDPQLRGIAHRALAQSDSERFGRELAVRRWTWAAKANHWENDYGSRALIEGSRQWSFDEVAPRLAPWRLLEGARLRGADPAEVALACDIFGRILGATGLEEPDPGAILSVDRSDDHEGLFSYSVSPIEPDRVSENPVEAMRRGLDRDAQVLAYQRAAGVAVERVRVAREAGADLYLTEVRPEDLEVAIVHCPNSVSKWIEGCDAVTTDFSRRVRLAEGTFLSLAEALLKIDPERGSTLFRAVRKTISTEFVGRGRVDELIQIPFRSPDSPAVAQLIQELVSLENCNTDLALLNIAIASTLNGREQWLRAYLAEDRASGLEWRTRRAAVLEGFTANNRVPIDGAWADGEVETEHEVLRRRSAQYRYVEACARHWWNKYLAAESPVDAYAAWVLFLRSADRRAWTWIGEGWESTAVSDRDQKLRHFQLNKTRLERAMQKREEKLERQFLARDVVKELSTWT